MAQREPTQAELLAVRQSQQQRALDMVDRLEAREQLTPRAVTHLRRAIEAGEETYPYISATDGPCVWVHAELRHYTAAEYDAYCGAREAAAHGG